MRRSSFVPFALAAQLTLALTASPGFASDIVTRLTDLRAGGSHGVPVFDAAVFGGQLYFQAQDDSAGTDLWRWNGSAPPVKVAGTENVGPSSLVVWDGALHFAAGLAGDREIWRYDGVAAPAEVLDLQPAGGSSPAELTVFDDRLCFGANLPTIGLELACWDGDGPAELFDLRLGASGGDPEELTVIAGELYMEVGSDTAGREPWSWNGVSAPAPLGDLRPGSSSSSPSDFVALGADLYFRASDGSGQGRLWRRIGSAPPELLSDDFDIEGGLAVFGGKLLVDGFVSSNEGDGQRLFRFEAGQFHELDTNINGILNYILFGADSFVPFAGALYLNASHTTTVTNDLYRYCGPGSGSVTRVTDAFAAGGDYVQSGMVPFQGKLLFTARTDSHGAELWQLEPDELVACDGLESGTTGGWSSTTP